MTANFTYAGSFTINYPDGEQARILAGITKGGQACNQGEGLGACAKRIIVERIKHEVKIYDKYVAEKAAVDAVQAPSEPSVS